MSLHLGKDKYSFNYIWENIHKIEKNKAIFGLGMPPVTGGKTGQIKSMIINVHLVDINVFTKSDEIPSLPVQVIKDILNQNVVVVVVLVFYGPSIHFSSFRARSVSLSTLFLGKPPRQFTST